MPTADLAYHSTVTDHTGSPIRLAQVTDLQKYLYLQGGRGAGFYIQLKIAENSCDGRWVPGPTPDTMLAERYRSRDTGGHGQGFIQHLVLFGAGSSDDYYMVLN